MPEPTATATLVAASIAVPAITAFGVPLGLRADLLIAGFAGSLVAIILMNTVPTTGDTWRELIRVSLRRVSVACASSALAGYMTPLALLVANVPDSMVLSMAFLLGVLGQKAIVWFERRYFPVEPKAGEGVQ